MDYFFEDYHFCIDLQQQADAVEIRLDIHNVKHKQKLQTLQWRIEQASLADALTQAQLRMRKWLSYRHNVRISPSSLDEIKQLLADKASVEEQLYQQCVDAVSEDLRIESFYRVQQHVENAVLRLARALARLPEREREHLFEQDANLMADMLTYDVRP
jgi:cob(I)alamin adenosyltransferase